MNDPEAKISHSAWHVVRSLNADRITAEVVAALNAEGIRSVLLKGASFSFWLYEKAAERIYVDCDLLVAPSEFQRAEEVLARLGFDREATDRIEGDWPKHARTWVREDDEGNVDLHRALIGAGADPEKLWRVVSEETETIRVAGLDVEALGEPGRVMMIALNAAKEASWVAKARRDLHQAVDRVPVDVWRRAAELARRLDAEGAFDAGLRTSAEGASLADQLGLAAVPPPEIALRLGERVPPLAAGINWLVSTPGVRGKARVVARKIFPPPSFMRTWSSLAARGWLGLVLAYLWRPIWLIWHAVPAVRTVARARSGRGRSARDRRAE